MIKAGARLDTQDNMLHTLSGEFLERVLAACGCEGQRGLVARTCKPLQCEVAEVRATLLASHGLESAWGEKAGDKLINSVKAGDVAAVLQLITAGVAVNRQEPVTRCTALMLAVKHGHTEIALGMIKAGARLDTQDASGATALMLAVKHGHTEIALGMIKAGARLDTQDEHGNTALTWAINEGHTEIALGLIEAGARPDLEATYGCGAPLILAAREGHTEIVKALEEQPKKKRRTRTHNR
jgi:hypothetical protein